MVQENLYYKPNQLFDEIKLKVWTMKWLKHDKTIETIWAITK